MFAERKGLEVFIVTGDRDALQLATDNVKVVINKKGMSEKFIQALMVRLRENTT